MRIQKVKRAGIIFFLFPVFAFCPLYSQERFVSEYRIGPKDLLEISVFGLDEMKKVVRVSEDGKIALPLLGEVEVEGLTQVEVEKKLSFLLSEGYLQNPQVTVFIREYRSKRISLLGAVARPGPYELLGHQTLLQVISQAGGLTRDAGNEIIVIRQFPDGSSNSLKIPIDDLFIKGDTRLNIPLQPDDIINVLVDRTMIIYVFGHVKNPGALQVKKSNPLNLLQAIAQAGGFTDRAARGRILIKRKDETGKEVEIRINVRKIIRGKSKNILLREDDVIFVPETFF